VCWGVSACEGVHVCVCKHSNITHIHNTHSSVPISLFSDACSSWGKQLKRLQASLMGCGLCGDEKSIHYTTHTTTHHSAAHISEYSQLKNQSHITTHYPKPTTHYPKPTTHFTHYTLHTTHTTTHHSAAFFLHISEYSQSKNQPHVTTHYPKPTTHYTLHITHYTHYHTPLCRVLPAYL
jgi:hypothetical protein